MGRDRRGFRGVSLWELLAVLAIAGTLAATAWPTFGNTLARARLVSSVNLMVGSLHFARSAAAVRGQPTVVCLSADGIRCLEHAASPARGWLIFHDVRRSSPVRLDAADTLLRRTELPGRVTAQGTRTAVTYWPAARAGTTSTFLMCHGGRPEDGRAVIVSQSGRPRVATDASWTARLRCT